MAFTFRYGEVEVRCDTADEAISLLERSSSPHAVGRSARYIPVASARPAKKQAVRKKAAASGDVSGDGAPRLTIRQRILNMLAAGPMLESQVLKELQRQGFETDHALTHQHLYLMKRENKVVYDEDTEKYRLHS